MSCGRRDCNCLNEWEERQRSGGMGFGSLTGGGTETPVQMTLVGGLRFQEGTRFGVLF